jgi:hypothetical protein
MGQHTGARIAVHLKDMFDRFELTDSRLLGMTSDNGFSNYTMTRELQSKLEASGNMLPALRNNIVCMAHAIHRVSGALMCSCGVKCPPSHAKPMSTISNLERFKA